MTTDERIITAVDVHSGEYVDGTEFHELLEKTDIDDKIKAQAEVIKDKAEEFKNMAEGKVENAAAEAEEVKDAAVETVEQVAEEVKGE